MTTRIASTVLEIYNALEASLDGDVVEVAPGTYQYGTPDISNPCNRQRDNLYITVGGNDCNGATHAVTLRAQDPNNRPLILGVGIYTAMDVYRGCTIDGFIIQNFSWGISVPGGEFDIRIMNCDISNTKGNSIGLAPLSHHILIYNCSSTNVGTEYVTYPDGTNNGKYANNISIIGIHGTAGCGKTHDVKISNCHIFQNHTHGLIDLHGCTENIEISNNNLDDTWGVGVFQHDGNDPTQLDRHFNINIHHNKFSNSFGGITLDACDGGLIQNNVFSYQTKPEGYSVDLPNNTTNVYFSGNEYTNNSEINFPNGTIVGSMPTIPPVVIIGDPGGTPTPQPTGTPTPTPQPTGTPTPTPPPTGDTGNIYFNSKPKGAWSFIDDVIQQYKTPILIRNVPIGIHNVKMSKYGYIDFKGQALVLPDMTTPVNKTLVPGIQPTPSPTPSPTGTPTPQPTGTPTPPPITIPPGTQLFGLLVVSSNPQDADVYVDDIRRSTNTPTIICGLNKGIHSIRITSSGYKDYLTSVQISQMFEVKVITAILKR